MAKKDEDKHAGRCLCPHSAVVDLIHQVMQKVEGHVTFHTAMSTAFPQPAPGSAPSPGPMKVEADRLKKVLGLSRMSFHDVKHPIAITDLPLEEPTQSEARQ